MRRLQRRPALRLVSFEGPQRSFTWERCGEATVRAYRDVLEDGAGRP